MTTRNAKFTCDAGEFTTTLDGSTVHTFDANGANVDGVKEVSDRAAKVLHALGWGVIYGVSICSMGDVAIIQ